jgi:hypothetical protein
MTIDEPKGLCANVVYVLLSGVVACCWLIVLLRAGLDECLACCSYYGCLYRTTSGDGVDYTKASSVLLAEEARQCEQTLSHDKND